VEVFDRAFVLVKLKIYKNISHFSKLQALIHSAKAQSCSHLNV